MVTVSPTIEKVRSGPYFRWGKRAFDAAAAAVGCLVLSVPMAMIAGISLAVQGRPVLFIQRRVGRFGRPISVLKFRTMTAANHEDPVTVAGDSRVTTWGSMLRRFKLDELPQVLCVLVGSMSLVGPRPDVPGYWDRLDGADRVLLDLRPGITGPASLVYRDEEEILARVENPREYNDTVLFPDKVRLARRYFEQLSLSSDLYWIVMTFMPAGSLEQRLGRKGWSPGVKVDTSTGRDRQAPAGGVS